MTPRCERRQWGEPDGLQCTQPEGHLYGHMYEASAVGDGHDVSEAAAEGRRG
jgi:hypothetical protein